MEGKINRAIACKSDGGLSARLINLNIMYYVYVLQSVNHPERRYGGKTTNPKKRLSDHNSGTTSHTKKYKPWKMIVYIAFKDEIKAIEFEKYLKTSSGRAFAKKRLL